MTQHCVQFCQTNTIGDLYGYMETVKKRHPNNVRFGEFMFSVDGNGEAHLHVFYEIGRGSE